LFGGVDDVLRSLNVDFGVGLLTNFSIDSAQVCDGVTPFDGLGEGINVTGADRGKSCSYKFPNRRVAMVYSARKKNHLVAAGS
jgi:hypothetical protein